jgi:nucleotide-binding universal stress UspA family protein
MSRTQRTLIVASLVAVLTVLHYGTGPHLPALHLLYRELYFVPIFLAGRWLGLRGGLATSLIITALYLPHMLVRWGAASAVEFLNIFGHAGHVDPIDVGNLLELVLFNVFAVIVGRYTDIQRDYATAIRSARERPQAPVQAAGRKLLLYLDESEASLRAARYVADMMAGSRVKVTLLTVYQEPRADLFSSGTEFERFRREKRTALENALEEARRVLLSAGFPEADIATREAVQLSGQPSDRVLSEQHSGGYDTIVLGKERLTKAQEFLFGSVAVRLVREARGGVLVVNPSEA